ncbi:MAG: transglutaminase-like domain-containing protein [Proteobacteria bacterium]|nr:transglutaminase-like domain-containing protein [Pseudomonadota bacterium]
MPLGQIFLSVFLALESLHLGLSMELTIVVWLGAGLSVLGALKLVQVERPTWGLTFVLLASGGFLGNQALEDWALEGSWAQTNGLGAGLVLSLLTYQLWLFASGEKTSTHLAINRNAQTILVLGLILILLIALPEQVIVQMFGASVAILTIAAILLASLTLMADRCADYLFSRLLLLLPLFLVVPLLGLLLSIGQGPVIAALGDMFPSGGGSFTPTGFSPRQQLRASAFLQPSNRAVMRATTEDRPNPYLVGNRLVELNEDLVWLPLERPLLALTLFDASIEDSGQLRFEMSNHQFPAGNIPAQRIDVQSLASNNFVFMSPNTSHLIGRFEAVTRNAANVWSPIYDRGANKRWEIETSNDSVPDTFDEINLQLPSFWDAGLQEKSEGFLASDNQQTVYNVLNHFINRSYSLETNFDPDQPFHDFFENEQAAYCFWFATGATLALRANDIPARIVGGYVIHEQLSDAMWVVRERDAHSWVEWQDAEGYWHTIDPTPPSIASFFDGYQSSQFSVLYHRVSGQWQKLIDAVLANELMADLIRYGGGLILLFLFVREYRRIQGRQKKLDSRTVRWQKVWQRFLSSAKLPVNEFWTAGTYAENLPAEWPIARINAARDFLHSYKLLRFSNDDELALAEVESSLDRCLQVITK